MNYSLNLFVYDLQKKAETDGIALVEKSKEYTYKKLLDESLQLASYLKKKGAKKGDTAVIASEPGYEFLKIIYATLILEIKVAIIDPHMGRELYHKKLEQLNPQWAFIDSRLLLLQEHPILRFFYLRKQKDGIYLPYSSKYQIISTGKRLPIFQRQSHISKSLDCVPFEIGRSFSDFEYIITYTSGTINEPKGVVHSINSIYESISHITNLLKPSGAQTLATHLPHFMLIGICAGIKVHLWKEKWSSEQKIAFLNTHQIELLFGPPSDYLELIKYCQSQNIKFPTCLKQIIIGSAPVHVPFLERLNSFIHPSTKITCMYGMTEHLIVAAVDGREKIAYQSDGDLLGDLVNGASIKINDDQEIMIKSKQLFKRYLHLSGQNGYHPTGDLGYIDDDLKLILTGRKKDMIIRENFNVYPALYEPTIKKINGIDEAVLIGVFDQALADEKIHLVIETQNTLDPKALLKLLRKGKFSIDKEAVPDKIVFRKIPRKGRQNKIDREKLRQELAY